MNIVVLRCEICGTIAHSEEKLNEHVLNHIRQDQKRKPINNRGLLQRMKSARKRLKHTINSCRDVEVAGELRVVLALLEV